MKREWKGEREAGSCKKFRNIFTLRECTSVTRIASKPVLRNPPQCFSLAPEAERRFCEFCYGIYILHAIPGALSRSEFIVANIAFPFAFITNPCLLRTVTLWKWNLSTHSRIFVKSILTRRHAAYKHPPQMKRINTKQLKKKKGKLRFEVRVSFRVFSHD